MTTSESVYASFTLSTKSSFWAVSQASLSETLNEPYQLALTLTTSELGVDPVELLGARATLDLERGGLTRRMHGVIGEVSLGNEVGAFGFGRSCTVHLVPALSMLAHRRDSRIFQGKSVPDILKEVLAVLSDYDGTFEVKTTRTYPLCEYRTQYDETDLELVLRLVGEEGMFFFFEHEGNVEHLVIADDVSAYGALESTDGDILRFVGADGVGGHEVVSAFTRWDRTQPTKLHFHHFDWTRPDVPLERVSPTPQSSVPAGARIGPTRETYVHDSEPVTMHSYTAASLGYGGDDQADQLRLRRQAHEQSAQTYGGAGTAIGLHPGRKFVLDHPNGALSLEYVVISTHHDIYVGDAAGDTSAFGIARQATYANNFSAVPSSIAYRAPRRRRRPVSGIMTATVVGPSGQEIHTDEHGRIKLQFHWDRVGKRDELSSCYVRVMQAWAGAGWGSWFLPRVGMEAVVTFIEGDPDRPVVTGTLYNGTQRSPFPLPNEATRGGIRTHSSPTTGGFNELRFEDSAGAEEVYLQAEKDLNELVKQHHSTQVLGDQSNVVVGVQTITVGMDRSVTVALTEETTIGGTRTETVTGAETIRLLDIRDVDVTSDDKLVVQGAQDITIQGAHASKLESGSTTTVTGDDSLTVDGGDKHTAVHGAYEIEVDTRFRVLHGDTHVLVEDKIEHSSPSKVLVVVGGNHVDVDAGGTVTVTAASELVLQCGSSKISLKSDGTITINGSTKVDVAVGSSTATATTSGYAVNGTKVDVTGSGQVNIKGGLVNVG